MLYCSQPQVSPGGEQDRVSPFTSSVAQPSPAQPKGAHSCSAGASSFTIPGQLSTYKVDHDEVVVGVTAAA